MAVGWSTDTWIRQLPTAQGSEMKAGYALYAGDALTSPNGKYTFVYQGDGNLVLYGPASSAVWDSKTTGRPAGMCTLNDLGHVTIYGPKKTVEWEQPNVASLWVDGARLVVQDDGNVVLYGELKEALRQ